MHLDVSPEANARYWRGAGLEERPHLFPLMAVNFTILWFQRERPGGILHTREVLRCHAAGRPGPVEVTGEVVDEYVKRSRRYTVVESEVRAGGGTLLWSSLAELASSRPCEEPDTAPSREWPSIGGPAPGAGGAAPPLVMTAELLRLYSRAGNFHSDDAAAQEMGLPGKVAMGMQTLGPVWGTLLSEWGDGLLTASELSAKFFGMVMEDEVVEGRVELDGDGRAARFEVANATTGRPTATGDVRLL